MTCPKEKQFCYKLDGSRCFGQGIHNNPHHILGMHECIDDLYINAYLPGAKVVNAIEVSTRKKYTLVSERVPGFFSVVIKDKKPFEYKLNVRFDNGDEVTYFDPYVFEPVIDPIDISLFNEENITASMRRWVRIQ